MGGASVSGGGDWLPAFLAAERLPDSFAAIVETRYVPMARNIAAWRGQGAPLVVGICGPQGSGKTTAAAVLDRLLSRERLRVARLSIDDLYLTRRERRALAAAVHPLFVTRGVPGTHDVTLGIRTLDALAVAGTVRLPVFDKAADDRLPEARWPLFDAAADIVLFEGWCVGARPQAASALIAPVNRLEVEEDADGRWRRHVNEALAGPYRRLFDRIDRLIQFTAPDFATVRRWRAEQEDKLRTRRGGGERIMDDAALARFLDHYERLTDHIAHEMPARADIVLRLGEDREITA